MPEQTLAESTKPLSVEELKQFGKQTGPLITILAPGTRLPARLKRLANEAGRKLTERGYDAKTAGVVMEPLLSEIARTESTGGGVALFASPGETRVFRLAQISDEVVAVG